MGQPTPGDELARFVLPVDVSKARELALASHSPDGAWHVAGPADLDGRAVSPAITFTAFHWHDREALMFGRLGLDQPRTLHGEHRWRLIRLPRVGERLHARTTLDPERRVTSARAGELRVLTLRTGFTSSGGDPVLEEDHVLLELGRPTAQTAPRETGARPPAVPRGAVAFEGGRRVGPLTRQDITRCAGATGDFNRLHCDEEYAHAIGLSSVFAMGKLQAGIVVEELMDRAAGRAIEQVRVRFQDRVWPGDVLELSGWWEDDRRLACTLFALREGEPVLRCDARLGGRDAG